MYQLINLTKLPKDEMYQLINLTKLLKDGMYRVISKGSYDKLVATANYMGSCGLCDYGVVNANFFVIYSSNLQHKLPLSITEFVNQYKVNLWK